MKQKFLWLLLSFSFSLMADIRLSLSEINRAFVAEFPHISDSNINNLSMIASNGSHRFTPSLMLFPTTAEEVRDIIRLYLHLKAKDPHISPLVVSAGGRSEGGLAQGWSFDAHAQSEDGSVVINTKNLTGIDKEIDWDTDYNEEQKELRLWVKSGTTLREMLSMATKAYQERTHDEEHYFMPIVAPTCSKISLGGCLASNSHSRSTSGFGGFFADTISAFTLVTLIDNQPDIISIPKTHEEELFNAIIGSFGRGGVVISVQIKLKLVKRTKKVITKFSRAKNIEDLTERLINRRNVIKSSDFEKDPELMPFTAMGGLITSDFKNFLYFAADFQEVSQDKPELPLFASPNCGTSFIHGMVRTFPKLSETLMLTYFDWHASKNLIDFLFGKENYQRESVFHNKPLENYIFFQDGFAQIMSKKVLKPGGYQTAHIAFVMKLKHLPLAMRVIKGVKSRYDITFEMQDVLPIPKTKVLMSPAYSQKPDDEDLVVYTISWPVNQGNQVASLQLRRDLEQALNQTLVDGHSLGWLHPLKEFKHQTPRPFNQLRAKTLELIFKKHGLSDKEIFTNGAQDFLYDR